MNKLFRTMIIVSLAAGFSGSLLANELCLANWEEEAKRQVGFVGNGSKDFGDFCIRVEMFVSKQVGGEFCVAMDESGAVEYELHGSSFETGKDCYSSGYNDAMRHWSHSCTFTPKDRFLVRTKSVKQKFCGPRNNEK